MMLITDLTFLDSLFNSMSPVVGNIYRRRTLGFR
jgi:hypothetical protein